MCLQCIRFDVTILREPVSIAELPSFKSVKDSIKRATSLLASPCVSQAGVRRQRDGVFNVDSYLLELETEAGAGAGGDNSNDAAGAAHCPCRAVCLISFCGTHTGTGSWFVPISKPLTTHPCGVLHGRSGPLSPRVLR